MLIILFILAIPAGILKSPNFNVNYPSSINYGNTGVTVGHELTHSLDDEGRQFDEKGNLHSWWNEDAIDRFVNRSECFVQQYSNQTEKLTGLNVSQIC